MENRIDKTVAIIIIGSEIIKGEIQDTNGTYISKEMVRLGYKVSSINIIGDEIEYAANLIKFLSDLDTIVITVGGLGPTLDDITMAGVAKAFGMKLISKPALTSSDYRTMSGSETQNNQLKDLPSKSKIIETPFGPIVNTKNVFSLPGLPTLVKQRFFYLENILFTPFDKIYSKEWVIELPQSSIAALLEEGKNLYPAISIGCYPQKNKNNRTKILLNGINKDDLENLYLFIMKSL